MRKADPWETFPVVQAQLAQGGAFLLAPAGDGRVNPMTIGWGLLGTVWYRQVFLVLVRPSRYSHGLIEKSGAFAVSVPRPGEMGEELEFCGTRSGREVDKVAELGLELLPGRAGPVPLMAGCELHYECRVVGRTSLAPRDVLSPEIADKNYSKGDLHTLFVGEILAAWRQ
ncbi:flavin reductase family protein [Candidatus Bipolaricaulota bacterium]|nr:flavin reductase family protein [Candidatus Bipolaricaulota bacterium]